MLMTINNSNKGYRATPEVGDDMSIMALRFLSLRRDFLQDCWWSKVALKLKSSTTRCCWDAGGGLATSKRLFTGLRLIVRFFDFPDETRRLLGPGEIKEGTRTGTYSTRPSSTTFEILTPDRDVESSDDGLMPPTACDCSCESFTTLRRSRASFTQPHTSATTWEQNVVSTWLYSSKIALCVILSEMDADSANIAIPESEKKFRWVKCGLLIKSCTQRMALSSSSSQIITRSNLMMNRPPQVTGPRTKRAVSWKNWKTRSVFSNITITELYHIGHDTYFKQMLTSTETSLRGTKRQDITYVRAAPRRRPLQLSLLLNKGLVFRSASLDLTALDPSLTQKTIEQKTQQMQWRMIVSSDDDHRTETAQPLSIFQPGSHSRQRGSRELF